MTKRRGKGEGSIFQTAAGTWRGYITLDDGRRKYVSAATRKEALEALRMLQRAKEAGRNLHQPDQTVQQFLSTWLEQVVKRQNARRTFDSYADMCSRYIIPALGRIRLDKLSPEHVQEVMNTIVDAGLSPRTAAYARAILRAALNAALKYGYVTRNVAALVDTPKAAAPFEGQAMTTEQVRAFLAAVAGHRLEPLYRLTLALGLRRGEVIALAWDNLNLKAQTLVITESKTGKRTATLTPALCRMLKAHKAYLAEEQLARRDWRDHGLLFPSERGTPLNGRNLLHHFKRTLARAGLPTTFRFHDLRHTAATLLASSGVHPRVAMELLGHTQIATTMEIYSHVAAHDQRAAVEALEALFGT